MAGSWCALHNSVLCTCRATGNPRKHDARAGANCCQIILFTNPKCMCDKLHQHMLKFCMRRRVPVLAHGTRVCCPSKRSTKAAACTASSQDRGHKTCDPTASLHRTSHSFQRCAASPKHCLQSQAVCKLYTADYHQRTLQVPKHARQAVHGPNICCHWPCNAKAL